MLASMKVGKVLHPLALDCTVLGAFLLRSCVTLFVNSIAIIKKCNTSPKKKRLKVAMLRE